MDNLTHGLLGLAVGALRRPERTGTRGVLSATDRAVLVACVVAAELPDLDTFWPSGNDVLQALQAHRGPSHSMLAAPLVAAVAVLLVRPFFRGARVGPMFGYALPSVLFAHLLADAWTGWGTRLFLPFSNARLSLDWTLVVDPLVTVPLLAGLTWALVRQAAWRKAILLGAAVAAAYVGLRAGTRAWLIQDVGRHYAGAQRVEVFPSPLNPLRWRYAVERDGLYHLGIVRPLGAPVEQAQQPAEAPDLGAEVAANATVREALAWARLPLVVHQRREDGGHSVKVADLRYHFGGFPTLAFHFELKGDGSLESTRFDRGGTARELMKRWRGRAD
jgi:inner membrane protein